MAGSALRRALVGAMLSTAACRLNFDPLHDHPPHDAVITSDALDAGNLVTVRFGERTASEYRGVTRDTYIDEALPTSNYGITNNISVDSQNNAVNLSLLRFDVSALAPGTRVMAARLEIEARQFSDASAGDIDVSALAEDWVEGTRNDAPGTGATWNERAPGSAWSTPGAPMITTSIGNHVGVAASGPITIELDATVVQRWVDDATQNFGIVLSPTSSIHMHFFSSNAGMSEARPQLSLEVAPW